MKIAKLRYLVETPRVFPTASVTRCLNKKCVLHYPKMCPKSKHRNFCIKNCASQSSPNKSLPNIWANLLQRTFLKINLVTLPPIRDYCCITFAYFEPLERFLLLTLFHSRGSGTNQKFAFLSFHIRIIFTTAYLPKPGTGPIKILQRKFYATLFLQAF